MHEGEATMFVAMLQAHFPTPKFPPSTVRAWTLTLAELPLAGADVRHAIEELGRTGTPRGEPIHISHVIAVAESIWADRYQLEVQEVQSETRRRELEAVIPASDQETREILQRYWDGLDPDSRARARVSSGTRSGDPEARIEAGRALARAQIEAEANRDNSRDGTLRPPPGVEDPRTMTTACGVRAGALSVFDEALKAWVCPNCGSPIAQGCLPAREKATAET